MDQEQEDKQAKEARALLNVSCGCKSPSLCLSQFQYIYSVLKHVHLSLLNLFINLLCCDWKEGRK